MKVTLLLYPLGSDLSREIPIYYHAEIPGYLPCHIMTLYRNILHQFMANRSRRLRGNSVAIRPFSMMYSALVAGRLTMYTADLNVHHDFSRLPDPMVIRGDYYVTFLAHYQYPQ